MAEWLRRCPAIPAVQAMGFTCAGSNPVRDDNFFFFHVYAVAGNCTFKPVTILTDMYKPVNSILLIATKANSNCRLRHRGLELLCVVICNPIELQNIASRT